MKKILCIAVACILAIVFALTTDVSALDLEKIQNTDWDTKILFTQYDAASGAYLTGGVGQSVTRILSDSVTVPVTNFIDWAFGNYYLTGVIGLSNYTYNPTTNKLKSTACDISYADINGLPVYSYSGLCDAKITFTTTTTDKTFEGTITYTDTGTGKKHVTTIKGKKLGKFSSGMPL